MSHGTPKAYRPQEGSVAWRVIEFFTSNPEEKLTPADISAKFEVPSKQVHSLLSLAVLGGALHRSTDEEDELVYRMGDGIPVIKPNRAAHPTLKGAGLANVIAGAEAGPERAGRRSVAELVDLDLDSVQVEEGVPLPPKGRQTMSSMIKAKLRTLQPTQSVQLPAAVKKSIGPVMSDLKKEGAGEFTMRLVDADHIRVWRVS
jgi:hypothetical protein